MNRLFCLSFLILIVVTFSSCDDQMKGVMGPVMEEVMSEEPVEDAPVEINYADLPLIENPELEPGLYRMEVTHGWVTGNDVYGLLSHELEGNQYVQVFLHPLISDPSRTLLINTEFVVRIYVKYKTEVSVVVGGTHHLYHGSVIKILKQPEKAVIDYEYQPTGYEDLPILRNVFAADNVQPGHQYLMFSDSWHIQNIKITSATANAIEKDVRIRVLFDPVPWSIDTDNMDILGLYYANAGVIKITDSLGIKTEMEGRKEITYHGFSGILIKNFTRPNILIEYEEKIVEEMVAEEEVVAEPEQ